jgi:hypothetical protein
MFKKSIGQNMPVKFKFLISLFVAVVLVFACSSNKSDKDKNNQTSQKQQQQTPDPKDQYRMVEVFENDKNQMIDLIEGPATFLITFEGEGNFRALLFNTEGKQLEVLADVNGNYKGKKTITVPQTSAYILDVHCKGKWSVFRE